MAAAVKSAAPSGRDAVQTYYSSKIEELEVEVYCRQADAGATKSKSQPAGANEAAGSVDSTFSSSGWLFHAERGARRLRDDRGMPHANQLGHDGALHLRRERGEVNGVARNS